ncbi:MAG TPA: hypothetical protein DEB06_07960 [Phycisphaerales bacterium]|nr:hypothetical protein [Phycisphaerales bacterium]
MSDHASDLQHFSLAAEIIAQVCALPAVATQDWCDRAAGALRTVRPSAIVALTIASIGPRGEIAQPEATGVSGTDTAGRTLESDALHPEHSRSLDWFIDAPPGRPSAVRAARLVELPCAQSWSATASARRWARLGVTDISVGIAPMPGYSAERSLAIEFGLPPSEHPLAVWELSLLRAMLPQLVQRATLAFGLEPSNQMSRLTQREQQVLEHLALGKSVKQIATDLARSPHTVHDHVKSLHRKLNASSRGELIARALGHLAPNARLPRLAEVEGARVKTTMPSSTAVESERRLMSA